MELRDTQALYNGFGDTLAKGFELVVTPAVFALIGHFLDRLLGTHFIFAVALGLFALIGMAVRFYFTYEAQMKELDAAGPWAKKNKSTSP
jgi:F0F1-type ATP synthase assembly protein I